MRKFLAYLLAISLLVAPNFAYAAIAFDAAAGKAVSASPASLAFTTTGSNLWLVVCTWQAQTTDTMSEVGYYVGSTRTILTKHNVALSDATPNDYTGVVWSGSVSAGSGTIWATTTSGTVGFTGASYTGVSGVRQATTTNVSYTTVNSITLTWTGSASTDWASMCQSDGGSAATAGTNATNRVSNTPGGTGHFDSNGTSMTNPFSMTVNWTGTGGGQVGEANGVSLIAVASAASYAVSPWWFLFW